MWYSKFKQIYSSHSNTVRSKIVIFLLKAVKLVTHLHILSCKLFTLYCIFVFGKCSNLIQNHIFKCHIASFTHEMIYSLKCYVLWKKNDLGIVPQVNKSRKQMMILSSLRKNFPLVFWKILEPYVNKNMNYKLMLIHYV